MTIDPFTTSPGLDKAILMIAVATFAVIVWAGYLWFISLSAVRSVGIAIYYFLIDLIAEIAIAYGNIHRRKMALPPQAPKFSKAA